MMEAHLPLFQSHRDDADFPALLAEFLLQLGETLVIEETHLLQSLPLMAAGHDHEGTLRDGDGMERHPCGG